MQPRPSEDDQAWEAIRGEWSLAEGVTYLNHGSFGLAPRCVVEAKCELYAQIARNPMAIFERRLDAQMTAVRDQVADLVAAGRENLVLVENATYGMNVVASNFPLREDDEVLVTDHEYGAVRRTWQRACRRAGARLCEVGLPMPFESKEQVVATVSGAVTQRTRLIVLSHITSGSAVIMPAAEICAMARKRGVAVCLDGPHAVASLPLDLRQLRCDYYTASCHKWLCGPFGTGFLYVHPYAPRVEPLVVSWGRVLPNVPKNWQDWFTWVGTRDVSSMLTLPRAIEFLEGIGWDAFRRRTHYLARLARQYLAEIRGVEPLVPDSESWYGPMITFRVPYADAYGLRRTLQQNFGFELLVVPWQGQCYLRVSCHLYNTQDDIQRLAVVLRKVLA